MHNKFSTAFRDMLAHDGVKNADSGASLGSHFGHLLTTGEKVLKLSVPQAVGRNMFVERILRDNTGKMHNAIRGGDGSRGHMSH